jgi:threonine dehydratase
MSASPVSIDSVRAAAGRVASHVHITPIMTCSYIDKLVGARVFFKCELFQKTGSFKV